jgi:hypothetical protein
LRLKMHVPPQSKGPEVKAVIDVTASEVEVSIVKGTQFVVLSLDEADDLVDELDSIVGRTRVMLTRGDAAGEGGRAS